MTTVDQAEAVLHGLAEKRANALARRAAIATETENHGYAALAEGDKVSQARLRELSRESLLIDGELAAVEGALDEARRRLAGARREAEREAMLERIAAARQLLPELRQAGAACSRALADFVLAFTELKTISTEIRRSGVGRWPTMSVFDTLARNALQKVLRPHGLSEGVLPAGNIRELQSVVEGFIGEYDLSLRRAIDPDAPPEPDPDAEVEMEAAQ